MVPPSAMGVTTSRKLVGFYTIRTTSQQLRIIPLLLPPLHSTQQILRREEATADGGDSFPFRTPLLGPGSASPSPIKNSSGATIPHVWCVDRFLVGSNSPCVYFTSHQSGGSRSPVTTCLAFCSVSWGSVAAHGQAAE